MPRRPPSAIFAIVDYYTAGRVFRQHLRRFAYAPCPLHDCRHAAAFAA